MTYVLTKALCHAERASFSSGLVVYDPGRSETLHGWIEDESAEELQHPSPEQRGTALNLQGDLAHGEDGPDDD